MKHLILWADDDLDDLTLMREVLQHTDSNYEIIEVNNGREALERLNEAKQNNELPSLIILDMNMPVLNGRDTLVALKNNGDYKNIPIVMFTTSNSPLDRMFCKKYNVEMFTKPPEYASLAKTLQNILSFSYLSKHES